MRKARFRVVLARPFDGAREVTVVVERDRGLISVRPLRRRREYVLPLAWAAEAVMWKVVRAEAQEKGRKRRLRRR